MTFNPVCVGTGLVALDIVTVGNSLSDAKIFAGGSCGNVITILSYMNWDTYPIARLSNNAATEILLSDINKWGVKDELVTVSKDGSTPIIIHRILKDVQGIAKHKFEFINPEDGKYLPSYKPYLAREIHTIVNKPIEPNVFYFDRVNRASIELAKAYKNRGCIIYFEPSSLKVDKLFEECFDLADVIKFSNERIDFFDKYIPIAKAGLEIQTLGSKGLMFRRKGHKDWNKVNSIKIDNVIDSAGAGDWCTAGIIYSLFRKKLDLEDISDDQIIMALKFGQVLSAINCTFEGARGLMYNISFSELLHISNHIISNGTNSITQNYRPFEAFEKYNSVQKISSLLEAV